MILRTSRLVGSVSSLKGNFQRHLYNKMVQILGGLPSLKLTLRLKMGHPKRELVFRPSIFRCYVSFRGGTRFLFTIAGGLSFMEVSFVSLQVHRGTSWQSRNRSVRSRRSAQGSGENGAPMVGFSNFITVLVILTLWPGIWMVGYFCPSVFFLEGGWVAQIWVFPKIWENPPNHPF